MKVIGIADRGSQDGNRFYRWHPRLQGTRLDVLVSPAGESSGSSRPSKSR